MSERREASGGGPSGTAGGVDLEPLRGGTREIERGELGPEHDLQREAEKDPPAPYHGLTVPEGGLSPRAEPGEGETPGPSRGEIEATAGEKIAQERASLENEGGQTPRTDS